jgi:ADP-heptose:LPS heptosyltransferase
MQLADLTTQLNDFSDTAALIANLDLVIGVDTAVIHLAGALGKPVWVLLAHIPEWRWLLDWNSSPWYPTMRLFRQERPGDWRGTITKLKHDLELLLAERAR